MSITLDTDIFSAFRQTVHTLPDNRAITWKTEDGYKYYSYGQLHDQISQWQHFLKSKGITRNDKVILLLSNQVEFPIVFLSLMSLGAVAVPLDVQFSQDQIKSIAAHCQAKLIVSSKKIVGKFKEDFVVNVSLVEEINLTEVTPSCEEYDVSPQSTAVMFYTSGTTSAPKGVMLSHANILSNYKSFAQLKLLSQKDSFISILPLHHAYAFSITMLAPLLLGAHVAFPGGVIGQDLSKCMDETKTTVLCGVPQVFGLLHRSILKKLDQMPSVLRFALSVTGLLKGQIKKRIGGSLRFAVCGGAKIDIEIIKDFKKWGIPLYEGYGLTETSPVVSFNTPQNMRIGSVGKPIEGVSLRILKKDDEDAGEVLVRGANVMQGYSEDEKATRDVLKEDWFYTGDLGYVDDQGFLFLTGRKKEMLVLPSGKNVFPDDVEDHYGASPFIKEIGVLQYNDDLVAIICPDEDHFKSEGFSQIRDRLKWEVDTISENMPSYKRLKGFVISVDELPRTRLGKIKHFQLKDQYSALINETSNTQKNEEESAQLNAAGKTAVAMIAKRVEKPVNTTDHLELDLGLDSLNKVELLIDIQEGLSLQLDEEMMDTFFMCSTVQDLLNTLSKCTVDDDKDGDEDSKTDWANVLGEDPAEKTKERIKLNFGFISLTINVLFLGMVKLFSLIFFRLKVEGRENIPKEGAYLICANHVSYLDALFICAALPMSVIFKTYFLGLSVFFENRFIRPFVRIARLIPIEVNYNLLDALRGCAYVFKKGKNVCYFPEGQRSIDGEVQEFKKGVGILITEFQMPVLPVFIKGAFEVWSRKQKKLRLGEITVRFGSVLSPEDLIENGDLEVSYLSVAEELRDKIKKLGSF